MTKREVLLKIHEQLEDFVAHKIEATSLCLRIKNIINDELKPDVWGVLNNADKDPEEYVSTLPDLARAAAQSPYGGATGRPRELKGWIRLPDGRRFYLGKIGVKFDGWSDGLLTEVAMHIHANKCEETEDEV